MPWSRAVARLLFVSVLAAELTVVSATGAGASPLPEIDDPSIQLPVSFLEPMKQPPSAGAFIPPPRAAGPAPTGHDVTGATPADDLLPSEGWTPYLHWKRNDDGTVTSEHYLGPQFRRTASAWLPIDTTIAPAADLKFPFRAPGTLHPVRFGNEPSRVFALELDGGAVTVQAPSLNIGTPVSVGNEVRYPNVAADTDLVYRVTPRGVRKELVLKSAAAPRSFAFRIDDPTDRLGGFDEVAGGGVQFRNVVADDTKLGVSAPFAYEAGDRATQLAPRDPNSATMTFAKRGDGYDVTLGVKEEWLAGRTFPVVLDPQLVYNGNAIDASHFKSTRNCGSDGGGCTPNSADVSNGAGTYTDTLDDFRPARGLFKFSVSSIPKRSRVDSATLKMYIGGCLGNGTNYLCDKYDYTLQFGRMHGAWDSNTAWRDMPTFTIGDQHLVARYPALTRDPITFSIAGVVGPWISGSATNYGMNMKLSSEPTTGSIGGPIFESANSALPERRPYLQITYQPPPNPPTNVQLSSTSNTSLKTTWTAPAANGGPAITSYEVRVYRSGDNSLYTTGTCTAPCTTKSFSAVPYGSYYARVYAVNEVGLSDPSDASNVVTLSPAPDLTKTVAPSRTTYSQGEELTYSLKVTNPAATDMQVNSLTDDVPATLSVAGASVVMGADACPATLCSFTENGDVDIKPFTVPGNGSVTFTYKAIALGADRGCVVAKNTATATNDFGSDPAAVSVNICDSALGVENWWTYVARPLSAGQSARINVANGNLVVQADDSVPVQARGRLAYVLRRTYNSQDTTVMSLPGSIGAGWMLNVAQADDLAGDGITATGLYVPRLDPNLAPNVADKLGVTMIDRDGTHHVFQPKGAAVNVDVTGLTGTTGPLASLVPVGLKLGTGFNRICVDVTYKAPKGVHLGLWRYIAVNSANGSCTPAAGTKPVVLGFAAERPDRLRYEFSATGRMVSMVDGSGVELRYVYDQEPLPGAVLGSLRAVYEPRSCTTTGTGPSGIPSWCRAFRFTYLTNEVQATDPAGRMTKYFTDGLLPTPRLTRVVNPDGSELKYSYQTSGGQDCGGSANQMCTATDTRNISSSFRYATAPDGLNRVVSFTDRRQTPTTITYTASPEYVTVDRGVAGATGADAPQRRRFTNIDATGRVGEVLEGDTRDYFRRQTHYYWDTPKCRQPDDVADNNLCRVLKRATPASGTTLDTAAVAGDEDTSFVYSSEGMLLARHQQNPGRSPATLSTTWGYHAQYVNTTGTVDHSDSVTGSGTVTSGTTARETPTTLFAISDRKEFLPPRGNAGGSAYPTYRTTYSVADNSSATPNAVTSTACTSRNTGVLCAETAPAYDGVNPTVTKYEYDSFGQRTSMQTPKAYSSNGGSYAYTYFADTDRDLSGNVTTGGWLRAVTDPAGSFVAFGYDRGGNVARTWDRNATKGASVSDYPGAASSPLPRYTETRYSASSTPFTTPWRYVVAQRDQLGGTTTYTVDTEGSARTIRPPRGNAKNVDSFDVTNDFDNHGNPTSVLLPDARAAAKPTRYAYDVHENRTAVTDPNGNIATTTYDSVNRPTGSAFTRGAWPADQATIDATVPKACEQSTTDHAPIPLGRIVCDTSASYDGVDNVFSSSDPDGQVTTLTYDSIHREVARAVPRADGVIETLRTETLYDADGRPTTVCPPREFTEGSNACTSTSVFGTHYTYDALGRVKATSTYRAANTAANTTTVEYDADGNVVKTTDANGNVNTAKYDLLGRRLSLTVPRTAGVTNTTHWDYDAVGNVTRVLRPPSVDNGTGADGDLVVDGATYPSSAPYRLASGKQYRNVTLRNGGWIAAMPQRLGGDGRVEFRATGTVNICGTCGITADGAGPLGGAGGSTLTNAASPGSGYGPGQGGAAGAVAGGGGGGAGHVHHGDAGSTSTGGGAGGAGGDWYGAVPDGSGGGVDMGSGGGGGGRGGTQDGAAGGAGGGSVRIIANEILAEGPVSADGGDAASLDPPLGGGGGGGGGGGSGGTVWLTAPAITGTRSVRAAGGRAGKGGAGTNNGGWGAPGRVRVDAMTVSGIPRTSGWYGLEEYTHTEIGLVTLYSYDEMNRLVDTVEGATSRTYAGTGPASSDGGSDIRTRRVYDIDGRVAGVYDPRAFASSVSDPDERYLTWTNFDVNGRPSAHFVPRFDGGAASDPALSGSDTQTTQCDTTPTPAPEAVGALPAYPAGVGVCVTTTAYDLTGNRASVTTPRPNGITSFTYTDDDLLAAVEIPNPTGDGRVLAQRYLYDASGRAVKVTDALDHQTSTDYTADGLPKKVTGHPNGTLTHTTTHRYDAAGQPTKQVHPVTLDGVLTDVETRTSYTADGLVSEVSAPSSRADAAARNVTKYTYDKVGNHLTVASPTANSATVEETNPGRLVTSYTYTDDNLLLTQVQPVRADGTQRRRTTYSYDPAGRKLAQAVALVDAVGSVVEDGKSQSFSYYPSDREATQRGRNGETISTQYDAAGNPRSITDSTSGTVTASFYLDGLVRSVTSAGRTTLHTYDGSGNRAARADVVDSTGARTVTRYTHNAAGLPTALTSDAVGGTWGWIYDKGGRLLQENQANGNRVVLQRNPDDTLASLQLKTSSDTDPALATYTYTYDEMYRTRTQNLSATGAGTGSVVSGTQEYRYYEGGQLKSYSDSTGTKAVEWDSDGNRVTYGDSRFTYNVDGSIKTSKDSASSPQRKYQYEPFGGVEDDGCALNTYDGFDRLTRSAGNGSTGCSGDRTDFTYDGLDRQLTRTAKAGTTGAVTTAFHYDGNTTDVAASPEGGVDTAYVLMPEGGPKAAVKRSATPVAHFLTDDGQSSVTLAHSSEGKTVCTARFDAFGTPLSPQVGATHPCSSGSTHNDVFYKGARRDTGTGTYQMGSRTYDPTKGGFLQPDTHRGAAPLAELGLGTDPLTRNRYAYVNGDPVNLSDPTGHGACWKFCGAVKAVASIAVDTVHTSVAVAHWTYEKVETAVEYVGTRVMSFAVDQVEDVQDRVREMRAAVAKVRDLAVDATKKVTRTVTKTVKTVKKVAAAAGKAVVSGVSYCLGRGARTCATVAAGVALVATGVGAIAGSALLAGTALAGAAGTLTTVAMAASVASGGFSLISYKRTGNKMDLVNAALGVVGPIGKGVQALRASTRGATASRTPLIDAADEIRRAAAHPAARNQRTIAVGADAEGRLFAGSSNGFDAGQRAAMQRLGIERVPGSGALHAEEELLRAVPGLRRVGTSVRAPCGPAEHNCRLKLLQRGVEIENDL